MRTKVQLFGNLLLRGEIITRQALKESLDDSIRYARTSVQEISPVRTGDLKRGWDTDVSGDRAELFNDVKYTPYVEARVGMLARTIPLAEAYFTRQLSTKLDRLN